MVSSGTLICTSGNPKANPRHVQMTVGYLLSIYIKIQINIHWKQRVELFVCHIVPSVSRRNPDAHQEADGWSPTMFINPKG
jgi:hypothetical protein